MSRLHLHMPASIGHDVPEKGINQLKKKSISHYLGRRTLSILSEGEKKHVTVNKGSVARYLKESFNLKTSKSKIRSLIDKAIKQEDFESLESLSLDILSKCLQIEKRENLVYENSAEIKNSIKTKINEFSQMYIFDTQASFGMKVQLDSLNEAIEGLPDSKYITLNHLNENLDQILSDLKGVETEKIEFLSSDRSVDFRPIIAKQRMLVDVLKAYCSSIKIDGLRAANRNFQNIQKNSKPSMLDAETVSIVSHLLEVSALVSDNDIKTIIESDLKNALNYLGCYDFEGSQKLSIIRQRVDFAKFYPPESLKQKRADLDVLMKNAKSYGLADDLEEFSKVSNYLDKFNAYNNKLIELNGYLLDDALIDSSLKNEIISLRNELSLDSSERGLSYLNQLYSEFSLECLTFLQKSTQTTLATILDEKQLNFGDTIERNLGLLVEAGFKVPEEMIFFTDALGLSSSASTLLEIDNIGYLFNLSQEGQIENVIEQLQIGNVLLEVNQRILSKGLSKNLMIEWSEIKEYAWAELDLGDCLSFLDKVEQEHLKHDLESLKHNYESQYQQQSYDIIKMSNAIEKLSKEVLSNLSIQEWTQYQDLRNDLQAIEKGFSEELNDFEKMQDLYNRVLRLNENIEVFYEVKQGLENLEEVKEAYDLLVNHYKESPVLGAFQDFFSSLSLDEIISGNIKNILQPYNSQLEIEDQVQDSIKTHNQIQKFLDHMMLISKFFDEEAFNSDQVFSDSISQLIDLTKDYQANFRKCLDRENFSDVDREMLFNINTYHQIWESNNNLPFFIEYLVDYIGLVKEVFIEEGKEAQIKTVLDAVGHINLDNILEENTRALNESFETLFNEYSSQVKQYCKNAFRDLSNESNVARQNLDEIIPYLIGIEKEVKDSIYDALNDCQKQTNEALTEKEELFTLYQNIKEYRNIFNTIDLINTTGKHFYSVIKSPLNPHEFQELYLDQYKSCLRDLNEIDNWKDFSHYVDLSNSLHVIQDAFTKEMPKERLMYELTDLYSNNHSVWERSLNYIDAIENSNNNYILEFYEGVKGSYKDIFDGLNLVVTNFDDYSAIFNISIAEVNDSAVNEMQDKVDLLNNLTTFAEVINNLNKVELLLNSNDGMDLSLVEEHFNTLNQLLESNQLEHIADTLKLIESKIQTQIVIKKSLSGTIEEQSANINFMQCMLMRNSNYVKFPLKNLTNAVLEALSCDLNDSEQWFNISETIKGHGEAVVSKIKSLDLDNENFEVGLKDFYIIANKLEPLSKSNEQFNQLLMQVLKEFTDELIEDTSSLERVEAMQNYLISTNLDNESVVYQQINSKLLERHSDLYVDVANAIIEGRDLDIIASQMALTGKEWGFSPEKLSTDFYHILDSLTNIAKSQTQEECNQIQEVIAVAIKLIAEENPQVKDDILTLDVLAHQFPDHYAFSNEIAIQMNTILEKLNWKIDYTKNITAIDDESPKAIILHQHNESVHNNSSGRLQEEMAVEVALRRLSLETDSVNAVFLGTEWSLTSTSLEETISNLDRLSALSLKYPNVTMAPASIAWSYHCGEGFGQSLYLSYNILPVLKAGQLVGMYIKSGTRGDLGTAQYFQGNQDKDALCIWGMAPNSYDVCDIAGSKRINDLKVSNPDFAQFMNEVDIIKDMADVTFLMDDGMSMGLEICYDHNDNLVKKKIEGFPQSTGVDLQLLTGHGSVPRPNDTGLKDGGMHASLDSHVQNRTNFSQVGQSEGSEGQIIRDTTSEFDKSRIHDNKNEINGGCSSHILLSDSESINTSLTPSISDNERSLFSDDAVPLSSILSQIKLSKKRTLTPALLGELLAVRKESFFPSDKLINEDNCESVRDAFSNMYMRYTFSDESMIDRCIERLNTDNDFSVLEEVLSYKQALKFIAEVSGQSFVIKYDLSSIPYEVIKPAVTPNNIPEPIALGYSFQDKSFYNMKIESYSDESQERFESIEAKYNDLCKPLLDNSFFDREVLLDLRLTLDALPKIRQLNQEANADGYINEYIKASYESKIQKISTHLEMEERLIQVMEYVSNMGMFNLERLAYSEERGQFYGTVNRLSSETDKYKIVDILINDLEYLRNEGLIEKGSQKEMAIQENFSKIIEMYRVSEGWISGISDKDLILNQNLDILSELAGL